MEKKTNIISVRVSDQIRTALESESEINSISVNTLINQILSKYIQWDRFTKEIGVMFLTKATFRALLSDIDENQLKILASSTCRGAFRDASLFMKGELSINSLIEILDLWLAASNISFRHVKTGNSEKYIIQHELGRKYSLYLGTAISAILSEVGHMVKNETATDQNLIFEIAKSK